MTTETTKEPKLTELQQKFVEALFSEEAQGNISKAIRMAGYAEGTSQTAVLSSKQVTDAIVAEAKSFMARNSGRAAWGLVNVLDKPNDFGANNKLKAAMEILNRAGVKDESESNQKLPESGIVILPAKKLTIEIEETPDNDGD